MIINWWCEKSARMFNQRSLLNKFKQIWYSDTIRRENLQENSLETSWGSLELQDQTMGPLVDYLWSWVTQKSFKMHLCYDNFSQTFLVPDTASTVRNVQNLVKSINVNLYPTICRYLFYVRFKYTVILYGST